MGLANSETGSSSHYRQKTAAPSGTLAGLASPAFPPVQSNTAGQKTRPTQPFTGRTSNSVTKSMTATSFLQKSDVASAKLTERNKQLLESIGRNK